MNTALLVTRVLNTHFVHTTRLQCAGPGIESRCGQLCLSHNHCDLQPWPQAVRTLPAVPSQLSNNNKWRKKLRPGLVIYCPSWVKALTVKLSQAPG